MNYRTVLSMIGSLLVGQGFVYGWHLLVVTNLLWIAYHYRQNNKASLQLHAFYMVNALLVICK